jgi:hypothetical protein
MQLAEIFRKYRDGKNGEAEIGYQNSTNLKELS